MAGMGVSLMGLAVVDSAARCEMPPPSSFLPCPERQPGWCSAEA